MRERMQGEQVIAERDFFLDEGLLDFRERGDEGIGAIAEHATDGHRVEGRGGGEIAFRHPDARDALP